MSSAVEVAENPDQELWNLHCNGNEGVNQQILIIDDDDILSGALSQFLTRRGYVVDCASEREEAEVLLTHIPYSLVITDLSLTSVGAEGFDLLRFIAALRNRPKTIVLTGHVDSSFQTEAQRNGAELYLNKPVKLAELAYAAQNLLSTHRVVKPS